jgi:hypothetical protein
MTLTLEIVYITRHGEDYVDYYGPFADSDTAYAYLERHNIAPRLARMLKLESPEGYAPPVDEDDLCGKEEDE